MKYQVLSGIIINGQVRRMKQTVFLYLIITRNDDLPFCQI